VANTEQAAPQKSGPSLLIQAAMLLALTALALGMGWLAGKYLNAQSESAAASLPGQAAGHGKSGADAEAAHQSSVVDLAPITTNLAAPDNVWIRLEASLVLDAPSAPSLADDVHQDLLGFLRTIKLPQIEGASGFQHLKADLEERAMIRSDGRVKRLLIRTLLFE
jgi:flagellar protein FliL